MKTKKIKIIVSIILIFVALVATTLTTLSLTHISYSMNFNSPSRIIVYYNNENNNMVLEPNDAEYKEIYSLILGAYKKSTINAITSNSLSKKVKIIQNKETDIDFDGVKISFVYDTPQVLKYKDKIYCNNDQTYWYQNLIFYITNVDNFQYNTVAIIPPIGSKQYVSPFTYLLHYEAYANFSKTYNYIITLF